MATRGFRATTVAAVCSVSKLPVGSVYWHFTNKDGLLAAVMERGSERFFSQLPDAASLSGSPRERFEAWFKRNAELLRERPPFLRLHLSLCLLDQTNDEVAAILQRVRTTALRRITEAMLPWVREHRDAGALTLTEDLSAFMLAAVDGSFVAQHTDGREIDGLLKRLWASLVAEVENGASVVG